MHRWIRSILALLVGGLILTGVSGCAVDEGSAGNGAQSVAQQASPAMQAKSPSKGAGQPDPGEAQVTTPARSIDAKQLTDVVKEEVKGGESTEGPTVPRPARRRSRGRASGRCGAGRASAAHAQNLCARVKPDYQGQI